MLDLALRGWRVLIGVRVHNLGGKSSLPFDRFVSAFVSVGNKRDWRSGNRQHMTLLSLFALLSVASSLRPNISLFRHNARVSAFSISFGSVDMSCDYCK